MRYTNRRFTSLLTCLLTYLRKNARRVVLLLAINLRLKVSAAQKGHL